MTTIVQQFCGLAQNAADIATSWHAQHAGPGGPLDFILVAAGVVIVLMVCIYTAKFFIRPQERDPNHIKRRILRDDF